MPGYNVHAELNTVRQAAAEIAHLVEQDPIAMCPTLAQYTERQWHTILAGLRYPNDDVRLLRALAEGQRL